MKRINKLLNQVAKDLKNGSAVLHNQWLVDHKVDTKEAFCLAKIIAHIMKDTSFTPELKQAIKDIKNGSAILTWNWIDTYKLSHDKAMYIANSIANKITETLRYIELTNDYSYLGIQVHLTGYIACTSLQKEHHDTIKSFGESNTPQGALKDFIENGEFKCACETFDLDDETNVEVKVFKAIYKNEDNQEDFEDGWEWMLGEEISSHKILYLM